MSRNVPIDPAKGAIRTRIRVTSPKHVAITAIDLYADEDGNGRPDKYIGRHKPPNTDEGQWCTLGLPATIVDRVIQWVWMPSKPADVTSEWEVAIELEQLDTAAGGGSALVTASGAAFPFELKGTYAEGHNHGIFETWIKLVSR